MKSLGPAPILLFLNASCLVLTASRGGALSAVAAASLATAGFALVGTDDRSAAGGVIAVAGMLAFAGAALLLTSGGVLLGRLADNPIADDRMVVFAAYWRSVLASPWWGYGLGAFHSVNALSMTSASAVSMGTLGAAHNVYLQWLLQSGAAGFVPMMICMGAIVGTILLGLGRRRRQPSIMIFALAVTSVFALHGITDYALEEPSLAAYFTVILGLGYGVATRR
jgi:O-antigen ligase